MTEYPIKESALAEATGISRPQFKKKREELLKPYDDFMKIKNVLHLTENAALLVLSDLKVSSPANLIEKLLQPVSEKKTPDFSTMKHQPYPAPPLPEKNAQIVAVITKLPLNTRIIEAVLENTERIRVKVHNNRMFILKQRIPVKNTGQPCWELDAKQPRRKGRIPGFNG